MKKSLHISPALAFSEDVAKKYPVAATYFNGQVEDWNYKMLIPPMIKLIQDLYKKIENKTEL